MASLADDSSAAISENAHKSGAGLEVIETALEKVREPAAPEIAEA